MQHLLIFVALIVNLWVGGDFVDAWLSAYARFVFEVALVLGYMLFVLRFPSPFLGRRRK
jgi:hypothetical protein